MFRALEKEVFRGIGRVAGRADRCPTMDEVVCEKSHAEASELNIQISWNKETRVSDCCTTIPIKIGRGLRREIYLLKTIDGGADEVSEGPWCMLSLVELG